MSKYSTRGEVYQSYLRNMCETFCIAYREVKRLEKEIKELQENSQTEEYKMVRELLKIQVPEEILKKYIDRRYTVKYLEKEKERLKHIKNESDKKKNEVQGVLNFWITEYCDILEKITNIIEKIEKEKILITVTCEEEIIGLMKYFDGNSVKVHRIINQDKQDLKVFSEEIYKEFYEAYCKEDDCKMKEVIRKYF